MQKPGQKVAMISSTAIDLPEHRKEAFEACLCEGVFPDGMESLPARDADAIRVSLEMVNRSDIYIGVFAWRYGHIPEGHDISITEMEFNRAVERKIPILIFLIHKEHPIVFEMVETGDLPQKKLAALKERACKGRGRREFRSPVELRAHVIHALSDLKQREWPPTSPADAIRTQKQRLEQLDPRFSVDITATADSTKIQIRPVQPIPALPKPKISDDAKSDALRALFEKGQSFQVKAAKVEVPGFPIHDNVFRELGDAEVTFCGPSFSGCLQFHFSSETQPVCIQIDGEWVLAPKRVSFDGQLKDSPLIVSFVRELDEQGKWKPYQLAFKLQWSAWEGQALMALAWFVELDAFFRTDQFLIHFCVRGHHLWPAETLLLNNSERKQPTEAMDWLKKCRQVAQEIGANPAFPSASAISEIESDNVRLFIKLFETGVHEQSNVGQIVGLVGEGASGEIPHGAKQLTANWPESFREINFFGLNIPFGPLLHTWTDVELVETRQVKDGRTELTFRGGPSSIYRIEYKRPKAQPKI